MNGDRARSVDLQVGSDVFLTDVPNLPGNRARLKSIRVRCVVRAEYPPALVLVRRPWIWLVPSVIFIWSGPTWRSTDKTAQG
jgi:hypothetical protein